MCAQPPQGCSIILLTLKDRPSCSTKTSTTTIAQMMTIIPPSEIFNDPSLIFLLYMYWCVCVFCTYVKKKINKRNDAMPLRLCCRMSHWSRVCIKMGGGRPEWWWWWIKKLKRCASGLAFASSCFLLYLAISRKKEKKVLLFFFSSQSLL